ncbi:MAG: DUF547 domain-containing protein [Gammaproteobacteria bacterium]|nr:DUF547 domain-containing protein [Gammaproteobacteria bacterium]NND54160.1 DUF547 domain-containing protein [Gammaproteobacteria bacterium]
MLMIRRFHFLRAWLLLLLTVLPAAHASLIPESDLWEFWAAHDAQSSLRVDHSAWQGLLDTYLQEGATGVNLFDYAAVTAADRARLQGYLDALAATDPRALRRNEQFAYWVNLYNALTVAVVLDHYPVKSIRRIKGGLLRLGPWNEPLFNLQGQSLTLNDIEHRILRPLFKDPRIHYAVNCASMGCPDLAAQAYTAEALEEQLDEAARSFINHPRGVQPDGKRLRLSSIYDWYGADFGADREGLLNHLSQYAEPDLAAALDGFNGRIRYDYDWRLNEPR